MRLARVVFSLSVLLGDLAGLIMIQHEACPAVAYKAFTTSAAVSS